MKIAALCLIAMAIIALGYGLKAGIARRVRAIETLRSALTLLQGRMVIMHRPMREALASLSGQNPILDAVNEVWLEDDPVPAWLSVMDARDFLDEQRLVISQLISSLTQAHTGLDECFLAADQALALQLNAAKEKLTKDGVLYARLGWIAAALVIILGL